MAKVTKIKTTSHIEKYELFAVTTNCNEFQFYSLLNQLLAIDLQAQKPYEVLVNRKNVSLSYFSAWDELRKLKVSVIDNQGYGAPLVDFLKNINFFVKIVLPNDGMLAECQKTLSENENVTFAQRIDREILTRQQNSALKALFDKI
ncbi:MAG: hypothetical protein J6V74_00620 [Bacteroidales bacterium]|nr:hypothetical protein [Bacteroidales bacterium]